ncbi:MAG: divalent metal cation transporter [Intrasporangium sp.]|uniref:NRAMP family divalent metal transporter n=1 Tax=Intrasporangium sp. TaxID=1925024 RepID=UPI00264762C0|nr:NRAMP family divalent metal transporter [Intrasporangium sp.]MDN5795922.1 divalent metal cation transporter [Intrasporangium sp.]
MDDKLTQAEQTDTPGTGTAGRSALLGAMFLMATSAIGPGFITQTTDFTMKMGAAFAFVIVTSVLVDIAVQLNVWRVIGVSGLRANELTNRIVPGLGWGLSALVLLGGIVFNIGNISGTGLGTDAMFGLEPKIGAMISAVIAIAIFLVKRAGAALDRIVVILGVVMIALTTWIAVTSHPPVGLALKNAVLPESINFLAITTLIGGTVGGYITYAGAHRLVDSGRVGRRHATEISKTSVIGVLVTGVMRAILFLAVLGVVHAGATLAADNPSASAFQYAAGEFGLRAFGIIFWAAALTSVIGASYTSISFLTTQRTSERTRDLATVAFIVLCSVLFLLLGKAPVKLLIFAGGFNGLILPIGFTAILWVAWRRRDLLHGYVYPKWLLSIGVLAWLLTLFLGWESIAGLQKLWG